MGNIDIKHRKTKIVKPGVLINPKDYLCISSIKKSLSDVNIDTLKVNPIEAVITEVLDDQPDKMRVYIKSPSLMTEKAYIHKFDYDDEFLEEDESHKNLNLVDGKLEDRIKNHKLIEVIRYPGQSIIFYPDKGFKAGDRFDIYIKLDICTRSAVTIQMYIPENIVWNRSEIFKPIELNKSLLSNYAKFCLGINDKFIDDKVTIQDLKIKLGNLKIHDKNYESDKYTIEYCIKALENKQNDSVLLKKERSLACEYLSNDVLSNIDLIEASEDSKYDIAKMDMFRGFNICETGKAVYIVDPETNKDFLRYDINNPKDIKRALIKRNSVFINGGFIPSSAGKESLNLIKADEKGSYKGLYWKTESNNYSLQTKSLKTGNNSTKIFPAKEFGKKFALQSAIEFNFVNTILFNKIGNEFNRMLGVLYKNKLWKEAITFKPFTEFEEQELKALWSKAFEIILNKGDQEESLVSYLTSEELNRISIITSSL